MISIIQSVHSKNKQFSNALSTCFNSLKVLEIDFQYVVFNDKGDKTIIDDIPQHILSDKNFEYHYSNINYGLGTAPGGMVGGAKLAKHK